jgi:hypothetical protein
MSSRLMSAGVEAPRDVQGVNTQRKNLLVVLDRWALGRSRPSDLGDMRRHWERRREWSSQERRRRRLPQGERRAHRI